MSETGLVSRRSFLKWGTLAAGAASACMLGGCAPQQASEAKGVAASDDGMNMALAEEGVPSFLAKPEAIREFLGEEEFEIVVVGAGAAGLTAALKAVELGASVAIVQKEAEGDSNGFRATGLSKDASPAEKAAVVSYMMKNSDYRAKRELLQAYVDNSGEAIEWFSELLGRAGLEDEGVGAADASIGGTFEVECDGYTGHFISAMPTVKYMGAAPALCSFAEQKGVTVFYSTDGVQLVQDESGRVTGVVGETGKSEYALVKASKGVILATGDYQGNPDMIAYYCPDVNGFPPLTVGRTGQGHCMGVWAGGRIEPVGHTKMIHDIWMNSAPYLMVDPKGNRFASERMDWWKINTLMRDLMQAYADAPEKATIWSVMDANYLIQAEAWHELDAKIKAKPVPEDAITHTADTLEALAAEIDADPATLIATVARYNELVDLGQDEDFGKNPAFLAKIEQGPFYAVQRDFNFGLSATLGGLVVDGDCRVLGLDDTPIEGLFAVGNTCGPFYGSIDYPMEIGGLSIGRAITTGYIAACAAAK